jgi:hypothetical protein
MLLQLFLSIDKYTHNLNRNVSFRVIEARTHEYNFYKNIFDNDFRFSFNH